MKGLFEELYALAVVSSVFLIPIYVLCKIAIFARTLTGSNFGIITRCLLLGLILTFLLYTLRYCVIQICSRLAPLTIDGDQLVEDYGINFTRQDKDGSVVFTLDDGIVTLIVKKGTTFVENVISSNSQLDVKLSDIGWKISNVSSASLGELSYIIRLGKDSLYLSEDQLVDFFSYLMARHYEDVKSEDMINEEIEKYCTGLGLVPSA